MTCPHKILASNSPGGVCPICGKRPRGRPKISLVEAFAMGRDVAVATGTTRSCAQDEKDLELFRLQRKLRLEAEARAKAAAPPKVKAPKRTTRAQVADRLDQVDAELLRRSMRKSLAEFVRAGWHVLHPGEELEWNWHMQAVCDHVQFVIEELIKARRDPAYVMRVQNLLINIPPRSAKTMIVGVFAPVWVWLHDPTITIRYCSSNPRVVSSSSRASRDLIDSAWLRENFAPTWDVRSDIDAVGLYENTERGKRVSSSFNQKVTGEGTDIIIVDDPHDAKDAYSDTIRGAALTKWDSALRNRVRSAIRCVRIGIMQRLHENDWAGHVMSKSALVGAESVGRWECVVIRQEFESADPPSMIGWVDPRTEPGELMHPSRFPRDVVENEKVELGSYGYAGQHQQRPAPLDGGIFKKSWWGSYKPHDLPRFDRILITVDSSFGSIDEKASRVSILVIGQLGRFRYVLDNETRVRTFLETKAAILAMLAKWSQVQPVYTVLIELKANGSSVIETLQTTHGLSGVIGFDPQRDSKTARAMAIQPSVQAHDVLLPEGMPWVEPFKHEFAVFPNGSHDDQVDALSQALIYMRGSVGAARLIAMVRN